MPSDRAPADPRPVGVLGGIGPLATAHFLQRVLGLTDARRDQDHVDLLLLSHATVPDRTAFLLGRSTDDPGEVLADDARRLARFGVSFLVMPCNTAHHFADRVASAVTTPLVSIVEATVRATVARVPELATVGVLATEGTARARLYPEAFDQWGIKTVEPDVREQARLTELIYDRVKAGRPADPGVVRAAAERLMDRGADVVVIACTELSIVAATGGLLDDVRIVDSLDALARATILRAGRALRSEPPDPVR